LDNTFPSLVCFLAVVSLLCAAGDARATEMLSAKHVAELRSAKRAVIAPDGKHIAYTLSVPHDLLAEKNGAAWRELHVVDREGNSRPFITGKERISNIAWSRDGRAITYVARRKDDEHAALYSIPVDGGESHQLYTHPADISGPQASPDGSQFVFLAPAEKTGEKKALEKKGFDQVVYEEDWNNQRLWLLQPGSGEEARALDVPGSVRRVRWHPDGRRVVVATTPTPSVDEGFIGQRLLIFDIREDNVVREIDRRGKLGDFEFSPDGKHLAMIAGVDIDDPRKGRLMVVALEATDDPVVDLMPDFAGHMEGLAWRDAQTILWFAAQGTRSRLGSVDLGGEVRSLSDNGPVISGLSLAGDGTLAVVGHTVRHPGEVFRLEPGQVPERLTHSNPGLADIAFGQQETITWQARDGLQLQGILIKPTSYRKGKRYPLIMVVHGGPEAHFSDGWMTWYAGPGQLAAGRGYMVFYPNYRGSTGRGVAFSKLSQGRAAAEEFDDLVDSVDHLVEAGLVDRDKVGITGSSYGGFASAWGATYFSEHFAASVVHAGISDRVSFIGTTDIPDEMFYSHERVRPWEDWEYFWTSSPVRYVQRNWNCTAT
jgi:dipeptidyl aminopeptidase/acylaminoacyl peptidase